MINRRLLLLTWLAAGLSFSSSGLAQEQDLGARVRPDWKVESDHPDAQLGLPARTAGDVKVAGDDDVIVGPRFASEGQQNEGLAFAYYGSATGPSATPDWTVEGDQAGAHFGSVSTAGDVNGDGYDDVIVSTGWYD